MQGFFEVWGEGATWEELVQSVNAFPEARKLPWLAPNITMKVHCPSWLAVEKGIRHVLVQPSKASHTLICSLLGARHVQQIQSPCPKSSCAKMWG